MIHGVNKKNRVFLHLPAKVKKRWTSTKRMLTSVVVHYCVSIKLWWVRVEDAYHNSLCKPKSAHSPAAGKTVWRKSSDCKEVLSCRKQSEIKIYCFDWRLKLDENKNQCLGIRNCQCWTAKYLKQNFNICLLVESVVATHLRIIEDCVVKLGVRII